MHETSLPSRSPLRVVPRWWSALAESLRSDPPPDLRPPEDIVPIAEVHARTRARIYGVISAIVIPPAGAIAHFDIDVRDDTARLRARWMDRTFITGLTPGTRVCLEGFVTCHEGQPRMYNPRYSIHGLKDSEL